MLFFRGGLFVVGPESASAHPGPACYRKGGPLTVTDANLLLGRLHVESFPSIFGPDENEPLDINIVRSKFEELAVEINKASDVQLTVEEIACGCVPSPYGPLEIRPDVALALQVPTCRKRVDGSTNQGSH